MPMIIQNLTVLYSIEYIVLLFGFWKYNLSMNLFSILEFRILHQSLGLSNLKNGDLNRSSISPCEEDEGGAEEDEGGTEKDEG